MVRRAGACAEWMAGWLGGWMNGLVGGHVTAGKCPVRPTKARSQEKKARIESVESPLLLQARRQL